MPLSVDWANRIIFIPQADLTPLGGNVFELDINTFRLELKSLEDDDGMPFPTTHTHTAPFSAGGVTVDRTVQIINSYAITFEDGQYGVNLVGGQSNIRDVSTVNQVSVRSTAFGLSAEQSSQLAAVYSLVTANDPLIQAIENDTSDMRPRVLATETTVNNVDACVDDIKPKLDAVQVIVGTIETGQTALQATANAIDAQTQTTSTSVGQIDARTSQIEANQATIQANQTAIQSNQATIATDIQTLIAAVNNLGGGGGGSGLTTQQAVDLTRILELMEADEQLDLNRLRKYRAGTTDIILDKTVSGPGVSLPGTIEIRQ